jgi:hypothetical protein
MRKTCIIVEWKDLPDELKSKVTEWDLFHKDVYLPLYSEFHPSEYQKGMAVVEEYWEDQKKTNGYTETLDDFIYDYRLEFDVWLIKQEFDFKDAELVLIKV